MGNIKIYDYKQFKNIISLAKAYEFDKALQRYTDYFDKYPHDYSGYGYYADCYMRIGEFEAAKNVLDEVLPGTKLTEEGRNTIFLMRVKLLCCCKKYEEAYHMVKDNIDVLANYDWNYRNILFYLKKELGLLVPNVDYTCDDYMTSQIFKYDEDLAIKYIRENRFSDGSTSTEELDIINNKQGLFKPGFDYERIFHEAKRLIPNSNRIYDSTITDSYFCKANNCGIVNGEEVNYVKINTLRDTNQIVLLRPFSYKVVRATLRLPEYFVDEDISNHKSNQIDKFYKRYGIKK